MSNWEAVIGLEVHVQLATKAKIFSGASTLFGSPPNTQACNIDLGMPGVLPVLNKEVLKMAIKFGLAINANINSPTQFARKNYFYPDLPKGYQISQLDNPIVEGGFLQIEIDGEKPKKIGITRAHLEEDAGKSLHEEFENHSGIDLNRAGTPLLEIVSEPELSTPEEAVSYLKKIHSIIKHLEISDGNMAEGSMRCDANVSVRKKGSDELGTRTETKNVNSFRFVEKAIKHEITRQIKILESGEKITQETRLYDSQLDETRSMRSKEFANDYNLSDYDAEVLSVDPNLSKYFEEVVINSSNPKLAANWVMGDLSAFLNKDNLSILDTKVDATNLGTLLTRIEDSTISGKIAKEVFEEMWLSQKDPDEIIEEKGLKQVTDSSEIERIIDKVFEENSSQLEQYKSGKEKLFGFFVGQVMKESKGKANPGQVNKLLKDKLKE